jgi:ribosomal protein S12 methylthiotransferase
LGKGGPKLPDLLGALLRGTTVPWFRLLYVYSFGLTEELVQLIGSERRIVPYIDIPIQHASDAMLERMRRPERQDTIRSKVAWLRETVPDIAIRSTAIVGFPGETDADFRELLDFADELQLERLGVFMYSPQEGTRAAALADDVPDDIKRERHAELTELQHAISEERLGRFVGKDTMMLVDAVADPDDDGATHIGRVPWQADDVDGITRLMEGGWAKPGDLIPVRVTGNEGYDFTAARRDAAC